MVRIHGVLSMETCLELKFVFIWCKGWANTAWVHHICGRTWCVLVELLAVLLVCLYVKWIVMIDCVGGLWFCLSFMWMCTVDFWWISTRTYQNEIFNCVTCSCRSACHPCEYVLYCSCECHYMSYPVGGRGIQSHTSLWGDWTHITSIPTSTTIQQH